LKNSYQKFGKLHYKQKSLKVQNTRYKSIGGCCHPQTIFNFLGKIEQHEFWTNTLGLREFSKSFQRHSQGNQQQQMNHLARKEEE